jgi:hypothetical protein
MRECIRTIITICLMLFAHEISAQDNYRGIAKKIFDNVPEYDSVILIYRLPAYHYDRLITLSGYGIKNYTVTRIHLDMDIESIIEPIRDSDKKKVVNKNIRDTVESISFSLIFRFNHDSLNLACANPADTIYYHHSDPVPPAVYGLFVANGNKYISRSCYGPEIYQTICPTGDRAAFIDLINKLQALLEK